MLDLRNQSISHATLKASDLARAFCNALETIRRENGWKTNYPGEYIHRASLLLAKGEDNWTEDEQETMDYFVNEIFPNALNDHAPDGYYFGAHPGDSSDFGFWEIDNDDAP